MRRDAIRRGSRRSSRCLHAEVKNQRAPRQDFMTRNEAIAANIAKRIVANTRKRFSTLHAEAIEETDFMSNSSDVNEQSGSPRDSRNSGNTSGMSIGSQVGPIATKPVDSSEADHTLFPAQPAPRSTTGSQGV